MNADGALSPTQVISPGDVTPRVTRELRYMMAWELHAILRAIAEGRQLFQIAEDWGVSYGALKVWKHRHKREVAEIAAELANPFAGMWIAKKENRIRELQGDMEKLATAGDMLSAGEVARARTIITKAVAEELGQLPGRTAILINPVIHVLEGVDRNDLT